MRAHELGLIPTTDEELRELKAKRDAKKFMAQRERERQRPKDDDLMRQKVFGMSKEFKPGMTLVTARKGRGPAREVKVEVVKRRRVKP